MTNQKELTEDEKIEAALAALDQRQEMEAPEIPLPAGNAPSPTLAKLGKDRRPKLKTVCEDCPNSVWFSSVAEVKCYCRVMFLITWSTKEPNQMTGCDGMFLGQE